MAEVIRGVRSMVPPSAPRRAQNIRKQEAKAAYSLPLCDAPFYLRPFQLENQMALITGLGARPGVVTLLAGTGFDAPACRLHKPGSRGKTEYF